jgi:hypothetical protein
MIDDVFCYVIWFVLCYVTVFDVILQLVREYAFIFSVK